MKVQLFRHSLSAVVTVEFAQQEYVVHENQMSIEYCVQLNGAIDTDVPIDIGLSPGGTAQLNTDFQFPPVTLTFQSTGNSTMCESVIVNPDAIVETNENFFLTLSSSVINNVVVSVFDAEITIMDSTTGTISYINSTISINEGRSASLCFTNMLSLERSITFQINFENAGSKFYLQL